MACVRSTMPTSSFITTRQRLALTKGILSPGDALALNDAEIDALFLLTNRVPVNQLRCSKLTPIDLKNRGLESAIQLRELGFDSLDLTNSAFCSASISAFGVESVVQAFLLNGSDAVAVAGSTAVLQLGITTTKLLELCAGSPENATAVLQQLVPRGGALNGVSANVLLDTGLRAKTLCELGYFLTNLRSQISASNAEIQLLGFI